MPHRRLWGKSMLVRIYLPSLVLAAVSFCFAQQMPSGDLPLATPVFRTVDFPGSASTIIESINDVSMIIGDYTPTAAE
jgi:hypothetical protein